LIEIFNRKATRFIGAGLQSLGHGGLTRHHDDVLRNGALEGERPTEQDWDVAAAQGYRCNAG